MDGHQRSHMPPFPPRQDGAVGILFAFMLSSALLCTVLALDGGRLYWEGQELQRLADMAALDAANGSTSLSSGSELDASGESELLTLAEESVEDNLPNANWIVTTAVEQRGIVPAVPGGVRTSCSIGACPSNVSTYNAVNVTVTRETCASIIVSIAALFRGNTSAPTATENCLTPATTPLSRSATASRPTIVAFSAGSSLLTLCTEGSPLLNTLLNTMLGTGVCLEAVGPSGILDADVSLLELIEGMNNQLGLSVASLDELLETQLTIGELVGSLSVLPSSYSDALSSINNKLNSNVSSFDLHISELLKMNGLPGDGSADRAALATRIGVGDLLSTAILLAHQCTNDCNSGGAISIPATTVNLGLVKIKELKLGIIQPPVIAIGPVGCKNGALPGFTEPGCDEWITEAVTSQISIKTGLEVDLQGLLKVELNIDLSGVGARAGISSISPANRGGTADYDLSVGGYNELLAGGSANGIDLKISLLPVLPQLSVIEGLLNGLLKGLGLSNLISVALQPLDLAVTSDLDLATGAGGGIVGWPQDNSTTISSTNLLESLGDTLVKDVKLKTRGCFLLCLFPTTEEVTVTLDKLVPGTSTLLQLLTSALDQTLFPLFDALGIAVNPTEVKILDVRTGSASLAI